MTELHFAENHTYGRKAFPDYAPESTAAVRRVHAMAPNYAVTPLRRLKTEAEALGVQELLVKDESERFGLKAFKGLGGFYAMFRVLCEKLALNPMTASVEDILQEKNRAVLKNTAFITTTDGNHGKGVSWAAKQFGCRSFVFMPKGTVPARAEAIRTAGNAEVTVTDMTYDECVAYTAGLAEKNGWVLIQDVAWEGYEEIPRYIMQGYTTLMYEAAEQLKEAELPQPTHVFLQAGVGSFAAAAAAASDFAFPGREPLIILAEPAEVACFYESFLKADGKPHTASGTGITVMAGLNCATPCSLAWDILKANAAFAFSCDDRITERGMALLAHPKGEDGPVTAGESGAVTFGLVETLCKSEYEEIRKKLRLDEKAVILLVNTEGDTDPEHYAAVTGIR